MTRDSISIRVRLALSAIAIVLIVIAAIAAASYREVRRSAIAAEGQRAHRIAQQLAASYVASTRQLQGEAQAAARDSSVRRFLQGRDPAAVRRALAKLATGFSSRNTLAGIEVWDNTGQRLITTSDSVTAVGADEARALSGLVGNEETAAIGWLGGVEGNFGYSVIAPVIVGGSRVGFVVIRRRVVASNQSARQLRDLIGTESALLVGNTRGDLWTSLGVIVPPVPVRADSQRDIAHYERPAGQEKVAALAAIPNTPWTLAVEFPLDVVLAPARTLLWRLALMSLTLVLLAAGGAWLVSGTLTRPIKTLVTAAKAMSAGDDSQRVAIPRNDEIGELGAAFNEMAERVHQTRGELEGKIDELLNAEARYQTLFNASPQPTWVFDLETKAFLAVNRAATQRYGYSVEEFLDMTVLDIRASADIAATLATLAEARESDEATSRVARHRIKDGSLIEVEAHARSLTLANRPARLVVVNDLTERRRAEESLRLAQERLERVIRSSGAVLYELQFTSAGPVLDWVSDDVTTMLGYSVEEVYGLHWWRTNVHPDDDTPLAMHLSPNSFRTMARDYRFRHKDGRYRWLRAEQRVTADAGGNPVSAVGAWIDITDQKLLEERLSQTQKMEAMGLLAGSVAHDFNNMLTVVRGYSGLLLQETESASERSTMIDEIINATDRAGDLTSQLLSFSRGRVMERRVLNIGDVVRDTQSMIARLVGENIDLDLRLDPDVLPVLADRGQLTQVLTNLAVNARDAMPAGGSLVIETSRVTLTDTYAEQHGAQPGPRVLLTVTDTGTGMDDATRARIFEPFFTTKGEGRGTGLGLSTVFGIVKQFDGFIWVYSEPNHGTTFKIYLPHFDGRTRRNVTDPAAPTVPRIAHAKVLLVDDDTTVLRVTRRLLEIGGYTVLVATNGEGALEVLRGAPVDLVITDTVMPKMGGHELIDQLSVEWPELPVVLTSGYTANAIERVSGAPSRRFFIEKPFTAEQLDTIVQEALRSRRRFTPV
jgi:PAS domain S-box-containing protein